MEDLAATLEQLKTSEEKTVLLDNLKVILLVLENGSPGVSCKTLLDSGIVDILAQLICNSAECSQVAAQVVAEVTKTEEARVPCVNAGLVRPLVAMLTNESFGVRIEACRAIGNICFDNDAGRQAVETEGGIKALLDLLRSQLGCSLDGASRLRIVACGFLLNLTNAHGMNLSTCNVQRPISRQRWGSTNRSESDKVRMITLKIKFDTNDNLEGIQEKVLELGAIEVLNGYLQQYDADEQLCRMTLLTIGCLTDSDLGRVKLSSSDVLVTASRLLTRGLSRDLEETVLDLLANLAESDDVKLALAKIESQESILLSRLKVYAATAANDDDSLQLEKLLVDLLVLILTGDGSMEELYQGGRGAMFRESLRWLQSKKPHLVTSGALAIGNFARCDGHCITLVKDGITESLLDLLAEQSSGDDSPTLQHAIFSALRNLAIPAVNKPLMLQCGLLERVLQNLHVDFAAVQFKLLATLRMAVDGQEAAAIMLGTNTEFVTQLVTWCNVEEHAGVKGEASRLTASLVKHSRSREVMKVIVGHGCLVALVAMAKSEHTVMQNEALLALNLISVTLQAAASDAMIESQLVDTISSLLTQELLPEVMCNVLTLTHSLIMTPELKLLLLATDIYTSVKKLQGHESSKVKSAAKTVASALDKK